MRCEVRFVARYVWCGEGADRAWRGREIGRWHSCPGEIPGGVVKLLIERGMGLKSDAGARAFVSVSGCAKCEMTKSLIEQGGGLESDADFSDLTGTSGWGGSSFLSESLSAKG